jgi:hypothetical protein
MKNVMLLSTSLLLAGSALAQPVTPIAPVPRYGPGSPVYTEPETYGRAATTQIPGQSPIPRHHAVRGLRLGRAGPPGSALPSGQVGPNCMTPLWKSGFHATSTQCPLYLPARPGAQEQCVAQDSAGRSRDFTVTFLDWNPATGTGSVDCGVGR